VKLTLWLFLLLSLVTVARAQTATVTLTCPAGPPVVVVDGGALPPTDAGVPPVVDSGVPPVVDAGVPPIRDAGGPPPSTSRPPASRGTGFYVVGPRLYDGNGQEFRMRGTNKTHQDNWGPGLGKTKSNTTRWLVYFKDDPDRTIADMQSPNIGGSTTNGLAVQVPGFWDGTCKSDAASFETMVARWVRDAKKYQKIERLMVLNIANEWGSDHRAWRDAYVAALPRIRNAGWHGAIMVDAPGCGQDAAAIVEYGAAVFAADPEKNVLFDWHIYGNVSDPAGGVPPSYGGQLELVPTMDALRDTGLTVIVGEFGPGRNIGPSPTMITPERIITVSEQHGIGWLSWSWEDNDQANAKCSNTSFCHVYDTLSASIAPSNLTDFGGIMVAQWQALATPASIFTSQQKGWTWYDYVLLGIPVALVLIAALIARHHHVRSKKRAAARARHQADLERMLDHDE
jgi:mannan endo-1,4-beta-mannosidase